MKVVTFSPTSTRYIRLEVLTAVDDYAAATEIAIGRVNPETSVKNSEGTVSPSGFILEQSYPNPFNTSTRIVFEIIEATQLELSIFNISGEKVKTIRSGYHQPGRYQTIFDASPLASGIYYYQLLTSSQRSVRKCVYLK